MGIQVALNHRTQYRYDKAVFLGPQVIQLRPAPHCRTPILSYSLNVTPAEHLLNWQLDLHNNHLARASFRGEDRRICGRGGACGGAVPRSIRSIFFWNQESKNTPSNTRRVGEGSRALSFRRTSGTAAAGVSCEAFAGRSRERSASWST